MERSFRPGPFKRLVYGQWGEIAQLWSAEPLKWPSTIRHGLGGRLVYNRFVLLYILHV